MLRPTVLRNNRGFTLVEVMIAFFITMIGFMALANVAVMTMDTNVKNLMRDEAVRIADERMNGQLQYLDASGNAIGAPLPGLKTLTYANLQTAITANPVCGPAGIANGVVTSSVKGMRRNFYVCSRVTQAPSNLPSNTFLAEVWVGWDYKGGSTAGINPTNRGYQIGTSATITKTATDR